jgi:hypothetical protein
MSSAGGGVGVRRWFIYLTFELKVLYLWCYLNKESEIRVNKLTSTRFRETI